MVEMGSGVNHKLETDKGNENLALVIDLSSHIVKGENNTWRIGNIEN